MAQPVLTMSIPGNSECKRRKIVLEVPPWNRKPISQANLACLFSTSSFLVHSFELTPSPLAGCTSGFLHDFHSSVAMPKTARQHRTKPTWNTVRSASLYAERTESRRDSGTESIIVVASSGVIRVVSIPGMLDSRFTSWLLNTFSPTARKMADPRSWTNIVNEMPVATSWTGRTTCGTRLGA